MLTMMRTKTFWLVAVVLFVYGIIQMGDDDPGPTKQPDKDDDRVNVALEIAMTDPKRDSIQVAISASLGSAGNHADRDTKVWEGLRFTKRPWVYKFKAKRGDALNAAVTNKGAPVVLMVCYFLQEGQGDDSILPGYGDITGPHLNAANGGTLARCAAVVR